MVFALGLVGIARTKMLAIEGSNSRNNPIRLGRISALSELMPVALPPGLFRLATRPIATGSVPTWKKLLEWFEWRPSRPTRPALLKEQ